MKNLFLLAVISSISFEACAQVAGGLKAGVSFSNFGGRQPEIRQDMKPRTGVHAGGFVNLAITEKFSFQPEFLFTTAGATWTELFVLQNSETVRLDVDERLAYLCIPMSGMYSFGRFNIHVGPQVSFLLQADDEVAMTRIFNGNVVRLSGIGRHVEHQKAVDLGLNFGACFDVGKFGLSARYYLGLINMANNMSNTEDSRITNNIFQLSLTYRFPGK